MRKWYSNQITYIPQNLSVSTSYVHHNQLFSDRYWIECDGKYVANICVANSFLVRQNIFFIDARSRCVGRSTACRRVIRYWIRWKECAVASCASGNMAALMQCGPNDMVPPCTCSNAFCDEIRFSCDFRILMSKKSFRNIFHWTKMYS